MGGNNYFLFISVNYLFSFRIKPLMNNLFQNLNSFETNLLGDIFVT